MKALTTFVAMVLSTASFAQIKSSSLKSSVMIDGKFSSNEWMDATEIKTADSLMFYVKHDRENIYLCLRSTTTKPVLGGVDFFVAIGSDLLNLHASAQLGERKFRSGSYGDFTWWNNDRWQANVARIDNIDQRSFHMDQCKEFQLRRSRFGNLIKFSYQVSYPRSLAGPFPQGATETNTDKWIEIVVK